MVGMAKSGDFPHARDTMTRTLARAGIRHTSCPIVDVMILFLSNRYLLLAALSVIGRGLQPPCGVWYDGFISAIRVS